MPKDDTLSWKTKLISVASLDLDQKNPRLGGLASHSTPREIVQQLFQRDKAMEIAESIATRGYFPNEPLLAIRENGRYTVVEGNRRLAALIALREPTMLEGSTHRKIAILSNKVTKEEVNKVPVTVAPTRRATDKQVAGRHVGTPVLAWQAENRARFILEKLNEGYDTDDLARELGFTQSDIQSARETRAIVEMARAVDLPPELKEQINDPRTTAISTLARLFESTVGREIMRVERDVEHGYKGTTTKAAFLPFFKKLLVEVASGRVTSRTLNKNEDIKKYFKEQWESVDLPQKKKGSFVPADLIAPSNVQPPAPIVVAPAKRQVNVFTSVIPKTLKVKFGAHRLTLIRDELVSLDRFSKPNAGAVLLRVFFELTVTDYLVRSGRMASLETRLKASGVKWKFDYPDTRHLFMEMKEVAKNNLTGTETRMVEKALFDNKSTPFGFNDLHSFVHVPAELPTEKDILQFWLRTEPLFRLMLEMDPSTHK